MTVTTVQFSEDEPLIIEMSGRGPIGKTGEPGPTGNGIESIELISTVDLAKTYRILYTNGDYFDYTVMDGEKGDTGNGIASIELLSTVDLAKTYRINFTDGNHFDYVVYDGEKGDTGNGIVSITKTQTSGLVDTYTILYTDGNTTTFDVTNGSDQWGDITGTLSDQTDLQNALNEKLDASTTTIMGDILTFEAENNHTLKNLSVDIEAVQDLHGYDNPWPAGGGTNQWDEEWEVGLISPTTGENTPGNSSIRSKNYIPVLANTAYRIISTYAAWCAVIAYDANKDFLQTLGGITKGNSFTTPVDCAYVRFYTTTDYGSTYKNDISIAYPSTVTAYAPYANICPISGWTGCNVTRTGRNLISMKDGGFSDTRTAYYVDIFTNHNDISIYHVKAGVTYTLSLDVTSSVTPFMISVGCGNGSYAKDIKSTLQNFSNGRCAITFTATESQVQNGDILAIRAPRYTSSTTFTFTVDNIQLELGSTPTPYAPYSGTTLPITWQSVAGTCYGGTVNVLTGEMRVTHKSVDLGTLTWSVYANDSSGASFRATQPDYFPIVINNSYVMDAICERYKVTFFGSVAAWIVRDGVLSSLNSGYLMVRETGMIGKTGQQFATAISGTKLVGKLATPLTYQLTPQQLSTLIGTNNLWADTGPSTAELYVPISDVYTQLDTKADADIVSETATSMVAPKNLTAGDLVYVNGDLFKATSNISNGSAMVVNTNVTATTIEAELKLKANQSTTYTKTEVNTALALKANADDVYTKAQTDTLLSGKSDTTHTHDDRYYTESETDALLANKAPVILASASGDIVSVEDGAPMPVSALSVDIEAVQDLHGQESPYPAGSTNNLIPDGTNTSNGYVFHKSLKDTGEEVTNNDGYICEYFSVEPSTVYTLSITKSAPDNNAVCFYDSNKEFISGQRFGNVLSRQVTTPANAVYARCFQYTDPRFKIIQFELGSTATAIKRYSNICPIIGFNGANIHDIGGNILDADVSHWDTTTNPTYALYKTGIPDGHVMSIRFEDNDTTVTADLSNCSLGFVSSWYTGVGAIQGSQIRWNFFNGSNTGNSGNISTNNTNIRLCSIVMYPNSKLADFLRRYNVMVTVTPEPKPYEPYSGTTLPITWQSTAGTVYGGTVNVLTGEMMVTHTKVSFAPSFISTWFDNDAQKDTLGFYISAQSYNGNYPAPASGTEIFEMYNYGEAYNSNTPWVAKHLFVSGNFNRFEARVPKSVLGSFSTYAESQTAVINYLAQNPIVMCYPLATPLTYQLTPQQLSTLLGDNVLWADCGSVALEYRADTKLYADRIVQEQAKAIKKMLTPNVLTEMKATSNLASGSIVIVGDKFLKTTSAVSNGSALVINNNCTETTVAEWVASLTA